MATSTPPTASWGVADHKQSSYGIVTDLTTSEEPIHQPLQDESGAIVNTTKYDTHYTLSMTVQVKSNVTPPTTGGNVTVGGKLYYVTRVERVYSNRDYQKLRVDGEAYTAWPTAQQS